MNQAYYKWQLKTDENEFRFSFSLELFYLLIIICLSHWLKSYSSAWFKHILFHLHEKGLGKCFFNLLILLYFKLPFSPSGKDTIVTLCFTICCPNISSHHNTKVHAAFILITHTIPCFN